MTGLGWVSTIHANPEQPGTARERRDVCALHSRVIDMTVGMPDDGLRILWATPMPGFLVVRAPEPITAARLPAGYASSITHRPWTVPDRPGRWRLAAVVNPGRTRTIGGPTLAQPNRPKHTGVRLYTGMAEQSAWLGRRLGGQVDDFRIMRSWTARGAHRTGRQITARCVAVTAIVTVTDPAAVTAAVTGGIGIDKTWGCGLTMWEEA